MIRPTRSAAVALAVALGFAGAYGGALLATPATATPPVIVAAKVVGAGSVSPGDVGLTRDALVGVRGDAVTADALRLLAQASRSADPAVAAQRLRASFGLVGPEDTCGDCGTIARVVAPPSPAPAESGGTGRPPAVVYAVTPDLLAVTVPHRAGDTVRVYPNTLNGDEPVCDPVIAGYDYLARELGRVEATVDDPGGFDPAFAERTTVGFDINEGLTVVLCAEVVPAGATEPDYRAQAIVRTADRLQPSVSLAGVTGLGVPGWSIRGYLPGGQQCGSVRVPASDDFTSHSVELDPARVLCDYTDVLRQGASAVPVGRGVLPLSAGDRSVVTLEQASWRLAPEWWSVDLGPAALCTGFCVAPPERVIVMPSVRGEVTLRLTWSQGNVNGVRATRVEALTDSSTRAAIGPRLDEISSSIRQTGFDVAARSGSATLQFRATEAADFTVRLVSDGTSTDPTECWRDDSAHEVSGSVGPAQGWSLYEQVSFEGLCAGSEYHAVVELSNASGASTADGWAAGAMRTTAMAVPVDIGYVLSADTAVDDAAVVITMRSDGAAIVGPRAGGCLGVGDLVGVAEQPAMRWGERVRLSGTLQLAASSGLDTTEAPGSGACPVEWATARPAITFETEFTLEEFLASPQGLTFEVGGDEGPHATVSIRSR